MPVALVATTSTSGDAAWVDTSTLGLTYWTEDGSGNLYPNTTNTQDFGSTSNQIDRTYTRGVISSQATGYGSPTVTLTGSAAHLVKAVGPVVLTSQQDAYGLPPSFVFGGSGYGGNGGEVKGLGGLHGVIGYVQFSSSGSSVTGGAYGAASFTHGAVQGEGTSTVRAAGSGAQAHGRAYATTGATSTIQANGYGATAWGHATTFYSGYSSTIYASSYGANASGCAGLYSIYPITSSILASGLGSFAHGYTYGGVIQATQSGAVAIGHATEGRTLQATGTGSIAMGRTSLGNITASAVGAIQIGYGTNNVANSIGLGPVRVLTTGVGTNNGEFWVSGGNVYCRSGNATRNLTNIP